jgi:hypothetical protein
MYGNDVKNEWRNDVWTSLGKLVPVTDEKKKGYVMALAGKRFLDKKLAERNGFDPNKIIGIDLDPKVVAHNTKHGRIVIQRELSEVMRGWDDARPVSVLVADFMCNGGAKEVQETIWNWAHLKAFKNCWFVLNVSVGRETRGFLQYLKDGALIFESQELIEYNRARGAMEYCLCEDIGWPDDAPADPGLEISNEIILGERRYQAHKMHMDSILVAPQWNDRWNTEERISGGDIVADPKIKRHIGAKLAWVTMRKTGKLGGRK